MWETEVFLILNKDHVVSHALHSDFQDTISESLGVIEE